MGDPDRVLIRISEEYEALKASFANDARSPEVAAALRNLIGTALGFLSSDCARVELISKVEGKRYFSFSLKGRETKLSRAVNDSLFAPERAGRHDPFVGGALARLPANERARVLYTSAMAYCCTSDILKSGDQKTPATFFECFVGHLLAGAFGVNPRTSVEVLRLEDESSTLPTDFIFDLGPRRPKFHVPVKTSTRERIIQAFAHQKVLTSVHGFRRFRGILVCLAETKLDHRRKEVIEICVPKQWVIYQSHIAEMHRFYYLDVHNAYAALAEGDDPLPVTEFAHFFEEAADLAAGD